MPAERTPPAEGDGAEFGTPVDATRLSRSPDGATELQPGVRVDRALQQIFHAGPAVDPLLEKVEPGHITAALQNAERENQRYHETVRSKGWFLLAMVGLGLLALIGLCWLFLAYDAKENLDALIAGVGGLVSGGLAGYGLARGTAG